MKKILLTAEDIPNKVQLQHAVSRLTKDYEVLKRFRGKNDTEDPRSLIATASFLDMLVRRESRNLDKGDMVGDNFILSTKERFITYLLSMSSEEALAVIDSLKKEIEENDKVLAHL
jgi:hypothetical protein